MLILWIRKRKPGEQTAPYENEQESFQKHNADMDRFRLSHQKPVRIIGVRTDEIDFQVFLPVSPGSRISAPAPILKHGSRVPVNQQVFFLQRVGAPQTAMGRMHAEPKSQRRILDLIERAL